MPSTTAITCPVTGGTSTENNPNHILPDMTFSRRGWRQRLAEDEEHQHRPDPEFSVAGDERYPQFLGEPDAPARLAQPEGRVLLRAHGRPGPLRATPGPTTSTLTRPTRSTRTSAGPNAMLGNLNTYTEGNNNTRSLPRFNQPEFFFQDNWRITRRLTLDLGVRFSHVGVVSEKDRDIGWFDPAAWDSGESGQPVATALRQRRLPVHRREQSGAQSDFRGNAAQPVDRRRRPRLGRHQQWDRLRKGGSRYVPQCWYPDRAAPRIRLGRLWGREDRCSRRIRHQLQSPG